MQHKLIGLHGVVIRRWFITYVVITLIPLATGLGIYARARDTLAGELIDTHNTMLRQLCANVDTWFSEINTLVFQMKNIPDLTMLSFAESPLSSAQIYKAYELTNTLRIYKTANSFIDEIGVYYPNIESVITSNGKYDLKTFHSLYIKRYNMPFTDWLHALDTTPASSYRLDPEQGMAVITRMDGRKRGLSAVIAIYLNINMLDTYFRQQSALEGGSILVSSADGKTVIARGDNVDVLGQADAINGSKLPNSRGYLYTSLVSENNGWRYSFLSPNSRVLEKTNYIVSYSLIVSGVALMLCILSALLLSFFQYQPLSRLLGSLYRGGDQRYNKETEYQFLERHLESLHSDKARMEEQLSAQGIQLGLESLRRLLIGRNYDADSIGELLQHYGITFSGSLFMVITITRDEFGQYTRAFVRDADELFRTHFLSDRIHTLPVMDTVCCVINSDKQFESSDMQQLALVWERLQNESNTQLWFSVSMQHSGLLSLPGAYVEKLTAFDHRKMDGRGGLIYFNDVAFESDFGGINYTNAFDDRFSQILCSGNQGMMNSVLEEIISQNQRQNLTVKQCRLLGYHLCMTYLKTARECQSVYNINLAEIMERLIQYIWVDRIDVLHKHYIQINAMLSKLIMEAGLNRNEALVDKIRSIVSARYTDPMLNVNTISDILSLNASYVSRTFAEKTGETLSAHLQSLRIKASLQMLLTDKPVAEIMEYVGYTNTNTFIRAFKRELGITPGQYREKESNRMMGAKQNDDTE
ncbi:hypothetical protein AGMMS49992_19110 [Clostridia bacterium]|nr:hypothetical protein AGMMS49992_19110 [Clostridia bacterium]